MRPGRSQCVTFAVAADQLRRAQQIHRQHTQRQRAVDALGFDAGQQRQRLGRRPGTNLVLQHLFAAVEGKQRAGAVAGQVVQSHHAAMRSFRRRLPRQQVLRMRQGVAPVAHVFGHLRQLFQRLAGAASAALALLFEPGGELAAGGGCGVAEHAVGIFQIVRQAFGQRQSGAADDGVDAERLAQLKQALAERVARHVGVAVGPQQHGHAGPQRGPFKRQPGQQRGVARGQRDGVAVGVEEAGCVGELKLHDGAGGGDV